MNSEERFQAAFELLSGGQPGLAEDVALQALTDFPDDGRLWELLGVACYRQGEYRAALAALESASLLKPLDMGARFYLARCFAESGKRDLAVFVYRQLADDGGTPLWLLPKVASQLGQMGCDRDALDVCRAMLRRNQACHEAHFGVGFYLRRSGALPAAVAAAFEQAHLLAPHFNLYRVMLAAVWQDMGRTEDAYELLKSVSSETIDCACSLRRMMIVFHAARDRQRGLACARRLDELYRSMPPTPGAE